MRLNSLIAGLARKRSGNALLIGIASLLDGVERMLTPRLTAKRSVPIVISKPQTHHSSEGRRHSFTIRQAQTETGITYWVARGFGCYDSTTVCDTWQEAMAEVNARLARRPALVTVPIPQYAVA